MNPFTYAHSFVSPGFYKCSIIMCWKLLRCADQSVGHKYVLLMNSLLLFIELGFSNKHFNGFRPSTMYRKEYRSLLHQTVEDKTQFAVGIRLL